MKSITYKKTIFILAILACTLSGQTYNLSFSNRHVSGSDFIFDIYMLNSGQDDLYLSDCDLVLTFNYQYFTNPTYQVVNTGVSGFYTLESSIISPDRAVLNIKRPAFSNQSEFNSRVTVVSKTGNGTRIATMKITGISNTSGSAGLQWRTSGLNRNSCTFLNNSDPWVASDKTDDAAFSPGSDTPLPIELVSFSAEFQKGKVQIRWKTASEINNIGFILYRSTLDDTLFKEISSFKYDDALKSKGQSNVGAEYSFVDEKIVLGQSYSYKLADISLNGEVTDYDPVEIDVFLSNDITSLSSIIPRDYNLQQNFPNPFNSTTNIRFDIPLVKSGNYHIKLFIFNQLGQKVKDLFSGELSPGQFKIRWDGKNSFGQAVASGMYYLVMQSNHFFKNKKLLLLK